MMQGKAALRLHKWIVSIINQSGQIGGFNRILRNKCSRSDIVHSIAQIQEIPIPDQITKD